MPEIKPSKHEAYNLPLGCIFGAETTCGFSDLAKMFRARYFKILDKKFLVFYNHQSLLQSKRFLDETSPPWYERINIIAPGFKQKSISGQERGLITWRPGTHFVVFEDNGRINHLEVLSNGKLIEYYRQDRVSNTYEPLLSTLKVTERRYLSGDGYSSTSLYEVANIIMLEPESKSE
jgi:hypothetical protein